ncbi:hypothetical protein FH975_15900 [Nesterenkonia sp. Hz 6-5]|nr:hypothetical protein [Nesterenkonia haasae]
MKWNCPAPAKKERARLPAEQHDTVIEHDARYNPNAHVRSRIGLACNATWVTCDAVNMASGYGLVRVVSRDNEPVEEVSLWERSILLARGAVDTERASQGLRLKAPPTIGAREYA